MHTTCQGLGKKHKKICATLNYIEHLLNLAPTVTGCFSISAFVALVGIPKGIASSAAESKICTITAGFKNCKSVIKKKKKKHHKTCLNMLAKYFKG